MNFKELENIKQELQFYKKDRKEVLLNSISDRLNKSLDNYSKELTESFRYISKQNELNVLKNIK